MKKLICFFLVVCCVVCLCSCGQHTDSTTTTEPYVLPTTIIDADVSLPYTGSDSFNPYQAKSTFNRDISTVIYESLYVCNETGVGKQLLASGSDINGTDVTVTILSGVRFSDGSVLTANHVKKSFDLASVNPYYKNSLSNIKSFTVADDTTVKIKLYNKDSFVLNTLVFPVVKADGDDIYGTGKYAIDYLEDTPFLEVNTYHRQYNSKWNKQIALYDMAGVSSPIYPFNASQISVYRNDLSSGEYTNLSSVTFSEDMNNLVYIGVNSQWAGTIISNSWMRQVINIGIDRAQVAASSFLGQSSPCSTFYPETFAVLNGVERMTLKGDSAAAVNLLEANGYKTVGKNGIRKNGENELNITVLVCSENPYKVDVAKAVKKSLESLGIGVTVIEKSTVEEYTAALNDGYFDLYIGETRMTTNYGLGEFFRDDGALSYGVSDELLSVYLQYSSGEITIDEFIKQCDEKVPVIPLFYRKSVVSVNPNISGVDTSVYLLYSVSDWVVSDD